MSEQKPNFAIFGASGLIGEALARALIADGFAVRAIARHFNARQRYAFQADLIEADFTAASADDLKKMLDGVTIAVNCVGVLQDTNPSRIEYLHHIWVQNLLAASAGQKIPPLFIHLSIPGESATDSTAFSQSKRRGEDAIRVSGQPYAILRPGFVIAPSGYGGSALVRSLSLLPISLPKADESSLLQITSIDDLHKTVIFLAKQAATKGTAVCWDVMAEHAVPVVKIIDGFRTHYGGPPTRARWPRALMILGAHAADLAAWLGWRSPARSTAHAELHRGVTGNPEPWIAATGITPATLDEAIAKTPSGIADQWFGRLYFIKPMLILTLCVFWIASGLIALFPAFSAAADILLGHGFAPGFAKAITIISSVMDIGIGCLIAYRRTHVLGLVAGIGLSLFYMVSAAIITPEMWVEPLGALVKTIPAIALMLTAIAISGDR